MFFFFTIEFDFFFIYMFLNERILQRITKATPAAIKMNRIAVMIVSILSSRGFTAGRGGVSRTGVSAAADSGAAGSG
jgi:hypothetical protein